MSEPLIYLLKVTLGISLVALPYRFMLRNDPNLRAKRVYLLAGLMLSWVIPLLAIRRPEVLDLATPLLIIDPLDQVTTPVIAGSGPESAVSWVRKVPWILILYLVGITLLLARNLIEWSTLREIIKAKQIDNEIAFTESTRVFTLFRRIFVPRSLIGSPELDPILIHERAHVRQHHYIDLAIAELTLLLTWFNPFSWLISRMIRENHEHLADRQVLVAGVSPARYRAQLAQHTLGGGLLRLGHSFSHSFTVKRLHMMKKPEKSAWGLVKLAMMLPAVLVATGMATGISPTQPRTIQGKVILGDQKDPATGAAVIIANTPNGTVVDRDGTFRLEVEGDPEIVISFVGYATLRIPASEIGKKPLRLWEKAYTLDLGEVPESRVQFRSSSAQPVREEGMEDAGIVPDGKTPTSPAGDEVFYVVEEMPMLPGGREALKNFIYSRLQFPDKLSGSVKQGEVMVQFLVLTSGELADIGIVSSTDPAFEEPVLSVIREMPRWNPGRQRGKPVRVYVQMPVRFNENLMN